MDNILKLLNTAEQYKDFVDYDAINKAITCELNKAIGKHDTFVQNKKYIDAMSLLEHTLEGTSCYLLMLPSEIRSKIVYYLDEFSKIFYYVSLISKGNDAEYVFFRAISRKCRYYISDAYLVHETNKHAVYHCKIGNHTIVFSATIKGEPSYNLGLYLDKQLISGELYVDYKSKINIIGKQSFLITRIYGTIPNSIIVSKVYLKTRKEAIAEKLINDYDERVQRGIIHSIHEYKLWESTMKK